MAIAGGIVLAVVLLGFVAMLAIAGIVGAVFRAIQARRPELRLKRPAITTLYALSLAGALFALRPYPHAINDPLLLGLLFVLLVFVASLFLYRRAFRFEHEDFVLAALGWGQATCLAFVPCLLCSGALLALRWA